MSLIYETVVINTGGQPALITTDSGFSVKTEAVSKASAEFTNPEQLIGASWSSCLTSTVVSILKARKLENNTRIKVVVKLLFDKVTRYRFTLDAFLAIEGMDLNEAQKIGDLAHKICPVSKLIRNNEGVTFTVENY